MGRTREQWESYCIEHLKENDGYFSIFWATENQFIANAMTRLMPKLKIKKLGFPVSKVTNLKEFRNDSDNKLSNFDEVIEDAAGNKYIINDFGGVRETE